MGSVRRRSWATAVFLLLFSLGASAGAHAPQGPDSAAGGKAKWRQGLSCATIAADQRQLDRAQAPVVSNCAPPPASHDGFRQIRWVLHPDVPAPAPASRSVVVAVHETACAGGRDPIPHLQRPEVISLEKTVVITLWIEELGGGIHSCPANPVGRLRVKLSGPLGPRQLYDGSSDPPRKVKLGEDPRDLPGR